MNGDGYGERVKARRDLLGLSQRALAARSGVTQPQIAMVEKGRRRASPEVLAALEEALAVRPSVALERRRDQVEAIFAAAGLPAPRVFGSVARGDDVAGSDVDLVVEFTDRHDVVDLLSLEHALSALLTVPVDIVDARASGPAVQTALREAVAL